MHLPSSAMHATRVLLALLCACISNTALAGTPLGCGTWDADDGSGRQLVIDRADHAKRSGGPTAPVEYLLRHDDARVMATDMSGGHALPWTISEDGTRIEALWTDYVRTSSAACNAPVTYPDSCRADIQACTDTLARRDDDQLRQWCRAGVGFACDRLLTSLRQPRDALQGGSDEMPAVCRKGTRQYDAKDCQREMKDAVTGMMARALGASLGQSGAVLPAPALQELEDLCAVNGDPEFCTKVADALWEVGQLQRAVGTLGVACNAGHPGACEQHAILRTLTPADLAPVTDATLPCGHFVAARGLVDTLQFGDAGLVDVGHGQTLRARLEDGQIRMRHDKGDDFRFMPIAGGQLLGMDGWNRYVVYMRDGDAGACSAPRVFKEVPLSSDCPSASSLREASQCCADGKLQGCNVAGHALALRGDWTSAGMHYLPLCRAGIRVGCENLRSTYENTGDATIKDALVTLCANSTDGSHVACDVVETTNWEQAAALARLGQAMGTLERDIEQRARTTQDAGEDTTPNAKMDK